MPVCLCETDPEKYFREIAAYYGGDENVFFMNPTWSIAQRAAAETLIARFTEVSCDVRGKFFIASGGSGGRVRFVAHSPKSLESSAAAFIDLLGLPAGKPLNCFSCLPPWHISGLMTFVRARYSGGKLFVAPDGGFREARALENFRESGEDYWTISLVPTQLKRIFDLKSGAAWLREFNFILLGGASVPADLIERSNAEKLSFGIGYGMTETASLVSLWRSGETEEIAGKTLPHARISLANSDSRIRIEASSLGETLGEDGTLMPNPCGVFETNDEGRFDGSGCLQVLGRADRYINSGGEKIDPKIVEKALIDAGAREAMVVGEADAEWGQRVVALLVPPFPQDILSRLRARLPAWMLPKRICRVAALPLDAKGKLDRVALAAALVQENRIR